LALWQYWPHESYTFTNLSPDEVTAEPCVFTAIGQGKPAAGQLIVVSNQVQAVGDNIDPLLHFVQANPMPNTDKWYADVQIGIRSTSAATSYTLTAWLVDSNGVESLTKASPGYHNWWTDRQPPPGAKQVATANVTRNAVDNCPKSGARS
jgi:hypothetical protein